MNSTGKKSWRWWMAGVVLVLVALAAVWLKREPGRGSGSVFVVRRGPLDINVLEGGAVQALESQEIKCEVRVGYQGVKILKIVEEGYQVTADDVRTNKALVELDSSDIKNRITQQDITFEGTVASLVEAQQAYDIQRIQNFGDIKAAEQKVRFARLDLDKLLGASTAQHVIDQLGLGFEETNLISNGTSPAAAESAAKLDFESMIQPLAGSTLASNNHDTPKPNPALEVSPRTAVITAPSPPPVDLLATATNTTPPNRESVSLPRRKSDIDFSQYANTNRLGDGEAKQRLRKFDDDLQLAQKDLSLAKNKLEGTQRLFARQFVTKTELEQEEVTHANSVLKVQTAETARDLYTKYEFIKVCEETVSKYEDALRELDRTRRSAISKLAQAEARLKSSQGRHNLEDRQRKELYEQLDKCVITAKKQGLVVYGGSGEDYYYGGDERIREGAAVRERQSIITIPDMTKMGVRVKIHETYIKKIKKDQKARITVDAYPDKILTGEVTKVGLLPDSGNRWMNPDLKVYLTTIAIQGVHDWLKPGMNAKVEILVDHLPDAVYVPIQAVFPENSYQVCYLDKGAARERRVVELGEANDEFIAIRQGLQAGDRVCLRAPTTAPGSATPQEKEPQPPAQEAAPPKPTPLPAPNPPGA